MPLTLADFVHRWKINSQSERASAQSQFIDLCDLLGEPHPAAADPSGERYAFEKAVSKVYGGTGFADVWLRDHFGWEYKTKDKHKDLKAAYKQLNDYREDLLNPPLLVVSDFNRFEIHTNFGNTAKRVYSFSLDELGRNQVIATCPLPPLDVLRALFGDTSVLRPEATDAFVTQEAAKLFSRLAERLEMEDRHLGATREQVAHFLMRILFCLFADSVGLLPDRVFRRLVEIDRFYPRRFLLKLPHLFRAMAFADGIFGEHTIRWFNGGLFTDEAVLQVDKADMGILYEVAHKYDWSHIAPAIFGTLFERSLDKKRRSLIGAHYTSEEDILLLIEPVVMRPLLQRWHQTRDSILALSGTQLSSHPLDLSSRSAAEGSALPEESASPSPRRKSSGAPSIEVGSTTKSVSSFRAAGGPASPTLLTSNPQAEALLAAFFDHLASVRILDPACGSGNFLYVALRRLLDLWKEARDFAIQQNIQVAIKYAHEKMVSPQQLFGIEIEFYAHELASIVVWIGFLQWKHENGIQEDREPILQKLDNIQHDDAIMRYDPEGKPFEPQWPPAEFIVGNPPFLGVSKMKKELGIKYCDDVRKLYLLRVPGGADLVTYWFEKSREAIQSGTATRVGLIATQAIRAGANRTVLSRISKSGGIFYAWSNRQWILAGASVRVSLIAFDDGSDRTRCLDGHTVSQIHNNLTSGIDTTTARPLIENKKLAFEGVKKYGDFEIGPLIAMKMLRAPANPNGELNDRVIRPWFNADDLTARPLHRYIIDFTDITDIREAALYEMPFEYIRKHVFWARQNESDERLRDLWWKFERPRPALRAALLRLSRYIATPRVSKHRFFTWQEGGAIPDTRVIAITRDDDLTFGVLQSSLHEAWSLATSSRHGVAGDITYNKASCFDTFPFPWVPGGAPTESESSLVAAISQAARTLTKLRDSWLNPPEEHRKNSSIKDSLLNPIMTQWELDRRTLTNLYNQRPAWLDNAHIELDRAVFAAYGWPSDLTTQQILSNLLALNQERWEQSNEVTNATRQAQ